MRSRFNRLSARALLLAAAALFGLNRIVSAGPPVAPPITIAEATALGQKIDQSMNQGDGSAFGAVLDEDAVIDTAIGGMPISPEARAGFKKGVGLKQALADSLTADVKQGGSYHFLHLTQTDGIVHPLFRLLGSGGGLNYHELTLGRAPDGTVRIVDLYFFTNGELFSQTLHRPAIALAMSEHRDASGQKTGSDSDLMTYADQLGKFRVAAGSGDPSKALAMYDQFPSSLKHDKSNMILRLLASEKVSPELYEKALDEFEVLYPNDPSLLVMKLDALFLLKKYDAAFQDIEQLDQRVGGDPYLDIYRFNVRKAQGRSKDAIAFLADATKRAPAMTQPWYALIAESLDAGTNAETARLLSDSAKSANLNWSNIGTAEPFKSFAKSPEYAQWVKTHPQQAPATTPK